MQEKRGSEAGFEPWTLCLGALVQNHCAKQALRYPYIRVH